MMDPFQSQLAETPTIIYATAYPRGVTIDRQQFSPLDENVGTNRCVLPWAFLYSDTLQPGPLQAALAVTLNRFPSLSGRVQPVTASTQQTAPHPSSATVATSPTGGDSSCWLFGSKSAAATAATATARCSTSWQLLCCNSGVPFSVHSSSWSLQQLQDSGMMASRRGFTFPGNGSKSPLPSYMERLDPAAVLCGDAPVLLVRLTQLAGGASILALTASHVVLDGRSYIRFMQHWADTYNSITSMPPPNQPAPITPASTTMQAAPGVTDNAANSSKQLLIDIAANATTTKTTAWGQLTAAASHAATVVGRVEQPPEAEIDPDGGVATTAADAASPRTKQLPTGPAAPLSSPELAAAASITGAAAAAAAVPGQLLPWSKAAAAFLTETATARRQHSKSWSGGLDTPYATAAAAAPLTGNVSGPHAPSDSAVICSRTAEAAAAAAVAAADRHSTISCPLATDLATGLDGLDRLGGFSSLRPQAPILVNSKQLTDSSDNTYTFDHLPGSFNQPSSTTAEAPDEASLQLSISISSNASTVMSASFNAGGGAYRGASSPRASTATSLTPTAVAAAAVAMGTGGTSGDAACDSSTSCKQQQKQQQQQMANIAAVAGAGASNLALGAAELVPNINGSSRDSSPRLPPLRSSCTTQQQQQQQQQQSSGHVETVMQPAAATTAAAAAPAVIVKPVLQPSKCYTKPFPYTPGPLYATRVLRTGWFGALKEVRAAFLQMRAENKYIKQGLKDGVLLSSPAAAAAAAAAAVAATATATTDAGANGGTLGGQPGDAAAAAVRVDGSSVSTELLHIPEAALQQLKAAASLYCQEGQYISTNDAVSSLVWLLMCSLRKRPLPGQPRPPHMQDTCLGLALDLRTAANTAEPTATAAATATTGAANTSNTAAAAAAGHRPVSSSGGSQLSLNAWVDLHTLKGMQDVGSSYTSPSPTGKGQQGGGSSSSSRQNCTTAAAQPAVCEIEPVVGGHHQLQQQQQQYNMQAIPTKVQQQQRQQHQQPGTALLVPKDYFGSAAWSIHVRSCNEHGQAGDESSQQLPVSWNQNLNPREWQLLCSNEQLLRKSLAAGAVRVRGALQAMRRDANFTATMLHQVQEGVAAPLSSQLAMGASLVHRLDAFITSWQFGIFEVCFGQKEPASFQGLVHPVPPFHGAAMPAPRTGPAAGGVWVWLSVPSCLVASMVGSPVLQLLAPGVRWVSKFDA